MKSVFLILFIIINSYAQKPIEMKHEYVFEISFPFEQRELNLPAPKITVTYNGQIIFNKASWSNPITEMPARVEGLRSVVNTVSLHVATVNGIQKTFSVDLNKGVFLFVYFDIKKNRFSIKQEVEARGYD